jgi:hypothetical protein
VVAINNNNNEYSLSNLLIYYCTDIIMQSIFSWTTLEVKTVGIYYLLRGVMLNFYNVMISVLFNCLRIWNLNILLF